MVAGYAHPRYAKSFSEFGTPRKLPRCGGWILERQIPGSPYRDAIGCYPLFVCCDWSQLCADLEDIGRGLVSMSLVTDPFGDYEISYLRRCFDDLVLHFKDHLVVDLCRSPEENVSRHHRYYARKAQRSIHVEECKEPMQFLEEWVDLYANLIRRHNIVGMRAFSRSAFAQQLSVPGAVVLRAVHQDTVVGAQIWFVQGEVAYSHLTACSELGYELRASYALYWSAIEFLSGKVRWLDLGGGAGVRADGADGLSIFKRGWSNGTRPVYFCGRIFDHARYEEIVARKGISTIDYFPAYRRSEFV